MYGFSDTESQGRSSRVLPAEAMNFDGVWIEDEIEDYRTLYVKGRESIESEITEQDTNFRDGTIFQRGRLTPRTITIGYQIIAKSTAKFRKDFNRLNDILNKQQAIVYFNDEQDKYFVGTKQGMDTPDGGRNAITSEFTIYCADPLKYSFAETIIEAGCTNLIAVDYKGTYPTMPIIDADIVCATSGINFLQLRDGQESVVKIGDTQVNPSSHYEPGDVHFYRMDVNNLKDWELSKKQFYINDKSVVTEAEGTNTNGFALSPGLHPYLTRSDNKVQSEYSWDAVEATKNIASSFYGDGNYVLRFWPVLQYETGCGGLVMIALRKNGADLVRVEIKQTKYKNGTVRIANSDAPEGWEVMNGQNFDFDGSEPVTMAVQSDGTGELHILGEKFAYTGKLAPDQIVITLGQYKTNAMCKTGIANLTLKAQPASNYKTAMFNFDDLVTADFEQAEIFVNGVKNPELGEIANDWDDFELRPGRNAIEVDCGATSRYPTITVRYREAYL